MDELREKLVGATETALLDSGGFTQGDEAGNYYWYTEQSTEGLAHDLADAALAVFADHPPEIEDGKRVLIDGELYEITDIDFDRTEVNYHDLPVPHVVMLLRAISPGETPRWVAPFTQAQVDALNEWQRGGQFHPYTCGTDSSHPKLVPSQQGWHCVACDYTQDWAHPFSPGETPEKVNHA